MRELCFGVHATYQEVVIPVARHGGRNQKGKGRRELRRRPGEVYVSSSRGVSKDAGSTSCVSIRVGVDKVEEGS